MTVTADQVAALRAALAGDSGAFDRIDREAGLGDGQEFPVLVAMAFIAAVRHQFPRGSSTADVIRFVSQVRVENGDDGDLSPTLAEQLILSALRDTPLSVRSGETARASAQFALLSVLVGDLDDDQLNTLLTRARDDADRWLAGRARNWPAVNRQSEPQRSPEPWRT